MEKEKRYYAMILSLLLLVNILPTSHAVAAKKVMLNCKKMIIRVGGKKSLTLKNSKKKVKWTVVSGKKYVTLKNKKKTSVTVVGTQKGIAKVQAVVGKNKYICKVTVKPNTITAGSTQADKGTKTPTSESTSNTSSVAKSTNINLYAVDSGYSKLTIPATYMQKYQIQLQNTGKSSYYVVKGDSATVSNTGLITPVATTYYWDGNVGSTISSGKEGETTSVCYNYETTVIEAKVNDKIYRYTVTVNNYAKLYADNVMNTYLSQNITSSMTNMEKLKKIAEFPCQYNYSSERSSAIGMIVFGGGDCWASTDAILKLCKKVGLKARARDAHNDPGAGSGHMNVIVKVDEKLYIVEAGYDETAPRRYDIEETAEYIYSVNSDNKSVSITNYNGVDSKVNIPQVIDKYLVTEIGNSAFYFRDEIRDITLPNSIKKIGDWAFSETGIQAVKIPDSVVEIGEKAFSTLLDYHGPSGSFGFAVSPEIVELSDNVKTLGMDLSGSIVLYHGTKEQWNAIHFSSYYNAPKPDKIFYSTTGVEVSSTNITVESNKTQELQVYSLSSDINVENSNLDICQIFVKNKVREYDYYRDESGDNVTDKIKTITIKGLKAGKAVLKISNNKGVIKNVNITVVESKKKSTEEEKENRDNLKKPLKVKNVKAKNLAGKKVKLTFAKGKNVKGYQIQYATNKNFKQKKSRYITKNQAVLKKLKKKNYYVRVRAYTKVNGKKVYGQWSTVKKVKVKK